MRPGRIAAAAALLCLALLAPGCGEGETATAGGEKTGSGAAAADAPAGLRGAARSARRSGAGRRCARALGDFLDATESFANAVAIGVSYESYLATVKRVRGAYAGVDAERLGLACVAAVGGPAERALNLYIESANAWGECLADSGCESTTVEPALQRRWRGAEAAIAKARAGLRGLG